MRNQLVKLTVRLGREHQVRKTYAYMFDTWMRYEDEVVKYPDVSGTHKTILRNLYFFEDQAGSLVGVNADVAEVQASFPEIQNPLNPYLEDPLLGAAVGITESVLIARPALRPAT